MKNILFTPVTMLLIGILLAGCGDADMEGIVIKVNEKTVLVAENLSLDRYEEISDWLSTDAKTTSAVEKEVRDTGGDISLIDLTYDNTNELEAGNEVSVWIEGDIKESLDRKSTR